VLFLQPPSIVTKAIANVVIVFFIILILIFRNWRTDVNIFHSAKFGIF
jgi:hypothetical protein